MICPLKVKVLKKSKDASVPEHIIVERPSTHEMAHLYFCDGALAKFTYIVREPGIKMAWDAQKKQYRSLLPSYKIAQNIVIKDGKPVYLKKEKPQKFFGFFDAPLWNIRAFSFRSSPDSSSDFFVEMDSKGTCFPNAYIRDYGVAEVKSVYHHQKKKMYPSKWILSKMYGSEKSV